MIAQIAILAVTAALAAGGAWQYQANKYERLLSDQRAEYLKRDFKALEVAHAETVRLREKAQAAAVAASDRIKRLADDRDSLRAIADGLRDDIRTAAQRLPSAPTDAVLEYATAVNEVYGLCAIRLEQLAIKAQGHADDVQTLIETGVGPVLGASRAARTAATHR